MERDLDPFHDAVRLLRAVPGIGDLAVQAIVAEIGSNMHRFPTAAHLVSWAGLSPAATRAQANAAPPACAGAHHS
ncbi:Transposase IS116/IS110/IS902 family protein [Belnapia rosea]|uniref:transposase n=1 Tax=Belnapia rosea TaxID=938405 RepID=UPI00088FF530|nr:Transposase IS116/IS110/IS902 family protein [Belnapia rosea]